MPAAGTSGATINVPQSQGLILTLQNSGTLTGTTFNVGQGTTVDLTGGTYTGGVVFNVAQGATVDLTGGQTVTYSGTLTGSGAGTVQLSGGTLRRGLGGRDAELSRQHVPVDRRWMELSGGDVTNLGTHQPRRLKRDRRSTKTARSTTWDDHPDRHRQSQPAQRQRLADYSENRAGRLVPDRIRCRHQQPVLTTNRHRQRRHDPQDGRHGHFDSRCPWSADQHRHHRGRFGHARLEPNSFSQLSGGTLTGGTWNASTAPPWQFPAGTTITSNAATSPSAAPGRPSPASPA